MVMKKAKKILYWLAGIALALYIIVCAFFYFIQEKILFLPKKLDKNYVFKFSGNFTEKKIKTRDGKMLDGLLFKADSSKGLIFYLHGNAGALDTWGEFAPYYTSLHYDLFIPDYSGYGKSEGSIKSEQQLYNDVQDVYNEIKTSYPENKIVILGYSIGTGPAAMLASQNNPRMLILQAPYYSMVDMMQREYSFLPTALLKYKLRTDECVGKTKARIVIFHGDADEVIYYGSSLKLKKLFKAGDTLITIPGLTHNGYTKNKMYLSALKGIL